MTARKWTPEEVRLLKAIYPDNSNEYVAEMLHRSKSAVNCRANLLGIFKSAECYDRQRRKGQFKSGHKPFNKGRDIRLWASKEGQEKIAPTRYKKGVPPKNSPTLRPTGYERIRREKSGKSYIYIKPEGRRMMPKHRWLWEQAHGPIPKGYNVQFKDGNSLNCTLDNLYLISRAKQIRKNFDDLPAERKAEVWAKIHETRNKAIRRDQLRLRWGLEPLGALVKRISTRQANSPVRRGM